MTRYRQSEKSHDYASMVIPLKSVFNAATTFEARGTRASQ